MNKKKIAIAVLVVFIVLVAIIVLVLKARVNSGTTVPTSGKAIVSEVSGGSEAPEGSAVSEEPVMSPVAQPLKAGDSSLSAMPGSDKAPKQAVIKDKNTLNQAIKLNISRDGFSPKEFTVKAGEEVTLALTSTDGTHVFIFPNASLMGLTTMVLDGETKTITFKAPKAGSFAFRDDLPQYRDNTGTMIVE